MKKCHGVLLTTMLGAALAAGCSSSDDPLKSIAKAEQYRRDSNYKAAVIELKNAVQRDPSSAEARYLLGVTYFDTGAYLQAEKELRRARELRYDSGKVLPMLGKTLMMLGEFQKVLDEVRPEEAHGPAAEAAMLTVRGHAEIALHRRAEGRALLEQALVKQPGSPDALLGLAMLALLGQDRREAGRLIDRALGSAPAHVNAWLAKGDLARMEGDAAGATAAFRKALELHPDHVQARLNLALIEMDEGRMDEARKEVGRVREAHPGSLVAMYTQALLEYRERKFQAARDAVQQVLKSAPDNLLALQLAGAIEGALGAHGQAQIHFAQVLERAPDNLEARKLMVASLARSGQVQRALEVLQPALKQAPQDGTLLMLAGETYLRRNQVAKAAEYFASAAKQAPKSAAAHTRLGMAQIALGETDLGQAQLENAMELGAADTGTDIMLVTSFLKSGDYDHALEAVARLEERDPANPLTFNLKAAIYVGKRDFATARKHLEHALALQPTYVPAAVNLAQLDLRDKNPQAARARLDAVLEQDAGNVQALMALAGLAPQVGASRQEQVDWLLRATKASPESLGPRLMLARLYSQAGEAKKALEAAQQAATRAPNAPEAVDVLGQAQLLAGEKEQALATFRKLNALQPDSAAALYRLASAQAANGDAAQSAATLRKALSIEPQFALAQIALVEAEVRAGRHEEALKVARQAQKQAPKTALGYILEGDVFVAEQKFSDAIKAYDAAYAMAKNGMLAAKRHAAYVRAGRGAEADERLSAALQQLPNDVYLRNYAAETSLRAGKLKESARHYEWLQVKAPDNAGVANNLAWLYDQLKDSRALPTAERAYKLKPEDPNTADTLGWMLVQHGDTTRGLELLQKAVEAAPRAPAIRYHYAYASYKAGDKARARKELEQVLASSGGFAQQAEAKALLERLRE